MGTTVYKTQVTLAATSSLCEGSQLLAVEIIVDAQREGTGWGFRESHCHIQALGYNCSETQVHFCLAQVLIVQIPFSSVRYIQYCLHKFPICLS